MGIKSLRRYRVSPRQVDWLKSQWYWFVFAALSLLVLTFLLFQKGVWAYVDAAETAIYRPNIFKDLTRYISALDTSFFFSHDQSQVGSYRIVPTFIETVIKGVFGAHWGQVVYFLSFFIVSFLASKKLFSYFFGRHASALGALCFTFNPIALYFISVSSYVYAYPAAVLIILGVYEFMHSESSIRRYSYLLVFALGLNFLFLYTRTMGLHATLLIVVGIFFIKPLCRMLWQHKARAIVLGLTAVLVCLPLLTAYISPRLTQENKYFVGASNYANPQDESARAMFGAYRAEKLSDALVLRGITSNISARWHERKIFKYTSILFVITVSAIGFLVAIRLKHRIGMFVSGVLLAVIFMRLLGKVASEDIFVNVMFSYYPFVANNMQWIYVIGVGCLAFLVAIAASQKWACRIILPVVSLFLLVSVVPFTRFEHNPRAQLFDVSKAPEEYKQEFYQGPPRRMASTAYTDSYFSWSPYPIINFTSKNQWLMSNNVRVVGEKQRNLLSSVDLLSSADAIKHAQNIAVLNLKKLYLYKDAVSPTKELIAWAEPYDVAGVIQNYTDAFSASPYISKEKDNNYFVRFGIKDNEKYEFNVYSPGNVIEREATDFYKESLNLNQKPLLIDGKAFNRNYSESQLVAVADKNPSVRVDVKESFYDQTRYYLKISNFDPSSPFILQLNKVYNPNWKIKWITKQDYDNVQCKSFRTYEITQNSVCQFDGNPLDVRDTIRLARGSSVSESNHFEGNYIGNTWIIDEQQIPDDAKELYAVMYYEKQTAMSISFMLSWLAIIAPLAVVTFLACRKYVPIYYAYGKRMLVRQTSR